MQTQDDLAGDGDCEAAAAAFKKISSRLSG